MCISICEQIILGEAEGSEMLIPVHRITMNVITVKAGYNIVLYWRFRYPSGIGIGDIIFQNGEKLLKFWMKDINCCILENLGYINTVGKYILFTY